MRLSRSPEVPRRLLLGGARGTRYDDPHDGPRGRRGRLLAPLLATLLMAWSGAGAAPATGAPQSPVVRSEAGAPPPRVDRPAPASGVWPLSPRPAVTHGFDPPAERWGSGHRGVDLAGHVGQPVRASLAGRITFAGRLAGRGVVVVDHGSTRTTYEPVVASVHVGNQVSAGDTIGSLALFGSHCLPRACLHWGWIEGRDHYLDPLILVGAAPVILLPADGPLVGARSAAGPRGPAPTTLGFNGGRLSGPDRRPRSVGGRLGDPGPSGDPSRFGESAGFGGSRDARAVYTRAADGVAPLRVGALEAPLVALGWQPRATR